VGSSTLSPGITQRTGRSRGLRMADRILRGAESLVLRADRVIQ
jgi:hypothetical protein